ncbi:unnamed protein product [Mytilus coruscus]|uniref:Integrase core domain-containing protein n=1 Tax=Mytilus coruscus TaxID=42192 RepID=A0A6J8AHK3_MYTCO|nr:unnamed protein product [Mytilus coruscus]
MALRYNHNDRQSGTNSFITGRSTSNQRIERLWDSLSAWCIQFWRHLFRHMRDHGILRETDPVHIESLRFCFMPLIQKQLDNFVHIWNLHRIRSQRNTETFSGIPNIMFYQPETFGAQDCSVMLPCSIETIERVSNDLILRYPEFGCRYEFMDVIEVLTGTMRHDFPFPNTVDDVLVLFYHLTRTLDSMFQT